MLGGRGGVSPHLAKSHQGGRGLQDFKKTAHIINGSPPLIRHVLDYKKYKFSG